MNPVEVMTSESQERMLAIVEPAQPRRGAASSATRWEIRATVVGRVTDTGALPRVRRPVRRDRRAGREPARRPWATTRPRVSSDREPLADVPVGSLGDGPCTGGRSRRPAAQDELQADDPRAELRAKFGRRRRLSARSCSRCSRRRPIADKTWVSRQYDHQLFLNTVAGPGARRRGARA